MNRINLRVPIVCLASLLTARAAPADTIPIGTLSYDTFIPADVNAPGVDAFNIANLTGLFNLSPDFPVTDGLTFQHGVLTLTRSDSTQQMLDLGDIGPGFLLDGDGNPVVQVPDNEAIVSAELTATLSRNSFLLYNGSSFTADASVLDIVLTPSSGPALTADTDLTVISVAGSTTTGSAVPEPNGFLWTAAGLGLLLWRRP